jgi:hypothetical protein
MKKNQFNWNETDNRKSYPHKSAQQHTNSFILEMIGLLTFIFTPSMHSRTYKSGELKWQSSIYGDYFRCIFNSNKGRKSCNVK